MKWLREKLALLKKETAKESSFTSYDKFVSYFMLVSDLEIILTMREIYQCILDYKVNEFLSLKQPYTGKIVISLSSAQVMMCFLFRDLVMDFAVNPFRNFTTNPTSYRNVRSNESVYFWYIEDISQSFLFSNATARRRIAAILRFVQTLLRFILHCLSTFRWCNTLIAYDHTIIFRFLTK